MSKSFFDNDLSLSLGFRADANNYSESMNNMLEQASPRFSLSFKLTPKWSVNFNTGRYLLKRLEVEESGNILPAIGIIVEF